LPVLERHEAVAEVRGRDRDVLAEPKRVVLVDPGVVARFDAGRLALEARTRIAIERPALGAVVAGRVRAVERALALAAIEAHEAAVRGRAPDDAVLVDVAAADAVALLRHVVDFRQFRLRIVTQEARRAAEHADGVPDRAVGRMRHHSVGTGAPGDALVLGGIGRGVRLDELVELAIAVGVEHERRPACALAASPVSSNTLVLSQPATWPVPLNQSVSSAS